MPSVIRFRSGVTGDINYVLTADPGAAYSQVITAYSYNTNNLLIGITDARQHQTTIEYDDADRQKRMIDADGNKTEYEYDGNNNLIKNRDR